MNGREPVVESTPEVERAIRNARVICAALVAAVLVYAAVAGALVRAGAAPAVDADTGALLRQAFVAVMLAGVLGWMVIWGRARAPTPSTVARPEEELAKGPAAVVRKLTAAYAFLEAVGLVGATVFLLTGSLGVLASAVAVVLLGAAISFPRREWFQRFLVGRPA